MADKDELNISQILGRVNKDPGKPLPPAPPSSPDDYAPKQRPPDVQGLGRSEAEAAQGLKEIMRDTDGWQRLPAGEREALDLIATQIGRICVGRNFWKELEELAGMGRENADA